MDDRIPRLATIAVDLENRDKWHWNRPEKKGKCIKNHLCVIANRLVVTRLFCRPVFSDLCASFDLSDDMLFIFSLFVVKWKGAATHRWMCWLFLEENDLKTKKKKKYRNVPCKKKRKSRIWRFICWEVVGCLECRRFYYFFFFFDSSPFWQHSRHPWLVFSRGGERRRRRNGRRIDYWFTGIYLFRVRKRRWSEWAPSTTSTTSHWWQCCA